MALFRRRRPPGVAALVQGDDGIALAQVVAAGAGGLPVLAACRFVPLAAGERPEGPAAALVRGCRLEKARFVGLLNREDYALFPAQAPALPRAEWDDNLRWKIADHIDFPAEEAVVACFDQPGEPDRIHVAAAHEAAVRRCAALFHAAGLDLTAIGIRELALNRLGAGLPDDGADGVALLHLGERQGLIVLTRNGLLHLARAFDIDRRRLERSLAEGGGGAADALDGGPLDGVALEVRRTLEYYESRFAQPAPGRLHVAPTAAPMPGLGPALAGRLGMAVAPFTLDGLLHLPEPVAAPLLAHCLPAIGAA